MNSENMELWNAFKTPPDNALKQITGGRLKGKTDINPQWRYEVVTEMFGPIGFGWNYELVREWIVNGSNNESVHFAQINFKYKLGEDWSEWIPGTGGSMFVAKEISGLHTSDESLKMAITDALSCALKTLGVASDIYRGFNDGSKYVSGSTGSGSTGSSGRQPPKRGSGTEDRPAQRQQQRRPLTRGSNTESDPKYVGSGGITTLLKLCGEKEITEYQFTKFLADVCGIASIKHIPTNRYNELVETIKSNPSQIIDSLPF
jgi:hypothetical protein